MTITAEQAAKLLEGTTPGPWRADGPPYNRIVWTSNENRVCFMAHTNGLDDARDNATSNLVAAAPELARALIASEAARKLAEERLAALIRRAHDAIIRDEKDGAVWAQLLADMAKEIDNG